jgi:cell filamentation protein
MDYSIEHDPYLIPGTDVLRNKLVITDVESLHQAEARITTIEIGILEIAPLPGEFNLAHLQNIHAAVFGNIYDWAGRLRTVEIRKDATEFAKVDALYGYAASVFERLDDENCLRNLSREAFVERLAHYYSEINLLHPFREGNGRVLRSFIHNLAHSAGWRIDWTDLDSEENIHACKRAFTGDESSLAEMLSRLLESNGHWTVDF